MAEDPRPPEPADAERATDDEPKRPNPPDVREEPPRTCSKRTGSRPPTINSAEAWVCASTVCLTAELRSNHTDGIVCAVFE